MFSSLKQVDFFFDVFSPLSNSNKTWDIVVRFKEKSKKIHKVPKVIVSVLIKHLHFL